MWDCGVETERTMEGEMSEIIIFLHNIMTRYPDGGWH